MNNLTNLSIVVQWDAVDDFLSTSYTVNWNSKRSEAQGAYVADQTSYTITGLTLDTVYTVTVTATNMCGDTKFNTTKSLSTGMCYFTKLTIAILLFT